MTDMEKRVAAKTFAADWKDRGDEKQETQVFWMALLQKVFGVAEPEKNIEFEVPVKLDHISYIDGYIGSTQVLIEQKSIDVDLRKGSKQSDGSILTPFQQARRYAGYLSHAKNPRWIVVCNFKEFHIHDMNRPNDAPEVVLLSDLEKLDNDTIRQMCGDIYDDSAWLTNLVENLLAVTKIEEGRMRLQKQPHLVEEIVTEALQHISRKQTEHTITVHHQNELLLAKCDARLIIQVIINLVDNAIKYTPAGSHITITTKQNEQHTEVSVADNGAGIPDSEKEKIFEMFYSGSNPIADCRRSLGLGLGLCKSIITAHGGDISVTDNAPAGTIFTFTIPSGEVEVHE